MDSSCKTKEFGDDEDIETAKSGGDQGNNDLCRRTVAQDVGEQNAC